MHYPMLTLPVFFLFFFYCISSDMICSWIFELADLPVKEKGKRYNKTIEKVNNYKVPINIHCL